jgi:hypothetical protein
MSCVIARPFLLRQRLPVGCRKGRGEREIRIAGPFAIDRSITPDKSACSRFARPDPPLFRLARHR